MKVLLISPNLSFRKRWGKYKIDTILPPLGLAYIAAVLEKNNHKVKIIDSTAEKLSISEIIKMIRKFKPEVVGISVHAITLSEAKKIAKTIKKYDKKINTIVGGPQITADPYNGMDKNFDFGVYGEGEFTFLELINKLENNKKLGSIKGLIFRKNGKIHVNKARYWIRNLDILPFPAYHLLPDLNLYHASPTRFLDNPIGTIVSSRGCPYRCMFCHRIFGRVWRGHSAEYVFSLMKYLVEELKVKEISFEDDLFIFNKERIHKLCKLIKKEKLNIPWQCSIRADLANEKLMKEMSEAGCWLIHMGIESGCQKVLDFIKKDITLNQIEKTVKIANKYKIKVTGYLMIGHPTETKEDVLKSINFTKKLNLHSIAVFITTPFPGTELWSRGNEYGKFKIDMNEMSEFSESPNFIPKDLTKEDLLYFQKKFYMDFYFRSKHIFNYIKWIISRDPKKSFKMLNYYSKISYRILFS